MSTPNPKLPTERLPPLQRPTPTTTIRVHCTTYERLNRLRHPNATWAAILAALVDFIETMQGDPHDQ